MSNPFLDEIREIRKEMAKEYGYGNDVKRFMTFLRELDAKSPRPHVDYSKPTPVVYPQDVLAAPVMVVAEEGVGYGCKQNPDEGQ